MPPSRNGLTRKYSRRPQKCKLLRHLLRKHNSRAATEANVDTLVKEDPELVTLDSDDEGVNKTETPKEEEAAVNSLRGDDSKFLVAEGAPERKEPRGESSDDVDPNKMRELTVVLVDVYSADKDSFAEESISMEDAVDPLRLRGDDPKFPKVEAAPETEELGNKSWEGEGNPTDDGEEPTEESSNIHERHAAKVNSATGGPNNIRLVDYDSSGEESASEELDHIKREVSLHGRGDKTADCETTMEDLASNFSGSSFGPLVSEMDSDEEVPAPNPKPSKPETCQEVRRSKRLRGLRAVRMRAVNKKRRLSHDEHASRPRESVSEDTGNCDGAGPPKAKERKARTREQENRLPKVCPVCAKSFTQHLKRHIIYVHKIPIWHADIMSREATVLARKIYYAGLKTPYSTALKVMGRDVADPLPEGNDKVDQLELELRQQVPVQPEDEGSSLGDSGDEKDHARTAEEAKTISDRVTKEARLIAANNVPRREIGLEELKAFYGALWYIPGERKATLNLLAYLNVRVLMTHPEPEIPSHPEEPAGSINRIKNHRVIVVSKDPLKAFVGTDL